MRKSGGIIGIVAGIFGVLAAIVTLMVGGVGGALESEGAGMVINLGWGGIVFSFLCIVFGAVSMGARGRMPGILLILTSLLGAILGGTLVAIFMILAFAGGIVATMGARAPAHP